MPIVNYRNLRIVRNLCGVAVPHPLLRRLEDHRDDPAETLEIGIEHAIHQCKGLVGKVPCIHFYAMNMAEPVERILKALN
jgi:5,10-methylenetetrahydrofolate reductase